MHGRLESVSRKMVLIFFKGNSFEFDPIFLKFPKFRIYHQGRFSFKYYKPCVHWLEQLLWKSVIHQKHKYMTTQMMVDLDWNERIHRTATHLGFASI